MHSRTGKPLFSLVVTSNGERPEELNRLFDSLNANAESNIELVFIPQDSRIELPKLDERIPLRIAGPSIPRRLPLSVARNIGLPRCTGEYVGFPDDDCWYPEEFFRQLHHEFQQKPEYGVICTNVYDPVSGRHLGKWRARQRSPRTVPPRLAFRLPISVGIFLRRSILGDLRFDERFGAGARWGAGEESDLLLRIMRRKTRAVFLPFMNVYHPAPPISILPRSKANSYAFGFGVAIGKHLLVRPSIFIEVISTLVASTAGIMVGAFRGRSSTVIRYWLRIRGVLSGVVVGTMIRDMQKVRVSDERGEYFADPVR